LNKKTFIIIISSAVSLILICGVVFLSLHNSRSKAFASSDGSIYTTPVANDGWEDDDTNITPTGSAGDPIPTEPTITEVPFVPATEMDLDPSSITVFVNKEYSLSKDYKPDDLVVPNIYFDLVYYDERTLMRSEAAAAIEKLFQAAQLQGYELCGVSGYRSYARQKKIFTENILTKGKDHTLKYSAVPGTSEHQTGLSMDISSKALKYDLSSAFVDTPGGRWVADNAYRFGFTIRYPKGKAKITGYAYEPWHIRYVGLGLAKYLYENDLTLEEYYHYVPSKDFNFEALYADLINITPIPTGGFPMDGDGFVLGENGEIIEGELGDQVTPPKDGDGTKGDDTSGDDAEVSLTPTPMAPPADNGDTDEGSGDSGDTDNGTGTDDPGQPGNEPTEPASSDITDAAPTPTIAVDIPVDITGPVVTP